MKEVLRADAKVLEVRRFVSPQALEICDSKKSFQGKFLWLENIKRAHRIQV